MISGSAAMGSLALVALAAAVLVGAVTMRATGMGFSLVASPFLVLPSGRSRAF